MSTRDEKPRFGKMKGWKDNLYVCQNCRSRTGGCDDDKGTDN